MAGKTRFSSYLAKTLVLFEAVSLTLVVGILYGILSRSMTEEFHNRLRVQGAQVSALIQDRLTLLETRLREMSLNNSVRVSLMLGVKSQLHEIVDRQYPPANGALFLVREEGDAAFIPPLPERYETLKPSLDELGQREQLHKRLFQEVGEGTFLSLFTAPIKRKDDRVGTGYLIYDISEDKELLNRVAEKYDAQLFIRTKSRLMDLRSGQVRTLPNEVETLTGSVSPSFWIDERSGESLIGLEKFPTLVYAASSQALEYRKSFLIYVLAGLCAAVFSLTLLVSYLLARKVSSPLENMADQALESARESSPQYLRDEELQHVEFQKLGQAFNRVLRSLLKSQAVLREKAEELDASKKKYRRLVEASPAGILSMDRNCNIRLANRTVQEITGRTSPELRSMNLSQLFHPDERATLLRLRETWRAGGTSDMWETRWMGKEGQSIWVEIRGIAAEGPGQESILLSVLDINERKHAEEERRILEEKLRHAEKMEAIGTLAGGVAHDLNNILSGLVGYPDLILMNLPEDSPLRKPVLTMQKSGQKAAAIVQDMLALARRGVTTTEPVQMNDIVMEYLKSPEFARLMSLHPEVHVETALDRALLNIAGSPAHLSKVVMNLVTNAAEAMPNGGKITILTENRYVDKPIRGYDDVSEGDYVTLTVSDNGIGIPPEDIGRIFEPFYTKKEMGRSGTGLGMAVVWGTMKDHKGYIDVQSIQGAGASFTLYFPVSRETIEKKNTRATIDAYKGNGESILIVDDVEQQREIACGMLTSLGYSVASVSSGEQAIDYLELNEADLVVVDMIMDPGIDGLETYRKILESHPSQKAIIVSGFSETERVREMQRLGAGAYVKKPYLLEEIGPAVKAELAR